MSSTNSNHILDGINLATHLDNTPLALLVWDKNGLIQFWSQRAAATFGWLPEEVVHKHIYDLHFIYEEDLPEVNDMLEKILHGNITFNQCINRNYTKSRKVIYCEWYNSALRDEQGNITSVLSLVQDITERKNGEVGLQKSQRQLSLIYNSAIDPMWLIDVEGENQYRFIDINETFTLVTGLTREQVIGKRMEEVLPPTSHEIVRTKYREAIESKKVIDYIEIAVHPAGKKVGEIRVIPVMDIDGKITKLVGIANDITDRNKAQEELHALNERLRNFTAHLQEVIEDERANIAREIHDELGQQLTAIKMDIAWVAQREEIKENPVYKRLSEAMELLDITVNTVRRIAMNLRPSILDDLGLQEALIWYAEEFENRSGITCEVAINDKTEKIANPIALTLFRVFQESLTNITRHAKATKAIIALHISENCITLKITDNGQGFIVKQQAEKKTLGLLGMEERIRKLNGHFEIQSSTKTGTSVFAQLPKPITI